MKTIAARFANISRPRLGGLGRALDGSRPSPPHIPRRRMLKDGAGDSGSTGWDAGFRSRLSLRTPQPDKDEHGEPLDEADPYARVLQRKKANYALREDEIELFWKAGVFYPKMSTAGYRWRPSTGAIAKTFS